MTVSMEGPCSRQAGF